MLCQLSCMRERDIKHSFPWLISCKGLLVVKIVKINFKLCYFYILPMDCCYSFIWTVESHLVHFCFQSSTTMPNPTFSHTHFYTGKHLQNRFLTIFTWYFLSLECCSSNINRRTISLILIYRPPPPRRTRFSATLILYRQKPFIFCPWNVATQIWIV